MPSWLLDVLILICLAILPTSLAAAWWCWFRSSLPPAKWRKRLLLSALLAASLNLVLYSSYFLYWSRFMYAPSWVKVNEACGIVGLWLLLWCLVTSLFGQGQLRFFLVVNCLLGILVWFPASFEWLA